MKGSSTFHIPRSAFPSPAAFVAELPGSKREKLLAAAKALARREDPLSDGEAILLLLAELARTVPLHGPG